MDDYELVVMLRHIANTIETKEKMVLFKSCLVCAKRFSCEYDVGYNEPVRINCPLWEERSDNDTN